MANHSRWEDLKASKPAVDPETAANVRSDFELGQLIYDLRVQAGISQAELARRMNTSQSAVSRLEEGGGGLQPSGRGATASDPSEPDLRRERPPSMVPLVDQLTCHVTAVATLR